MKFCQEFLLGESFVVLQQFEQRVVHVRWQRHWIAEFWQRKRSHRQLRLDLDGSIATE